MDDPVDLIDGIAVLCRLRRFDAAPLIDGHIRNDASRFHGGHHLPADNDGRFGAGDENAADYPIGVPYGILDILVIGTERREMAVQDLLQVAESIQVRVNDGDMGPHSQSHPGRIAPDNPAAENHHIRLTDSRYAAEQLPPPPVFLFKIVGNDLDRHATGHFRHGHQKRQRPIVELNRLVGNGGCSCVQKGQGQFVFGGQMKIREKNHVLTQVSIFGRLRFLDLHDHSRPFPHGGCVPQEGGPR
ncbi:MAG: hypothetical protein A4E69_02973 [Syntrophus sp. PtaB.Bin138]|nr:MAG: hypothetical protein A4E69_02973 [Syntrophus sp. PtaB.Bin138]